MKYHNKLKNQYYQELKLHWNHRSNTCLQEIEKNFKNNLSTMARQVVVMEINREIKEGLFNPQI